MPAGPASISGSAAAVAQRRPGSDSMLPAGSRPGQGQPRAPPGRAGEWQPRFSAATEPGHRAGQLGKASTGPGSICRCFPPQLLTPRAVQAVSVQEQPLLKQNNLQKYRYSLCPRPDLAKEEQGSCPGQGLAQPHRAFGHRGCLHPTLWARPVPSPLGSLSSSSSERALLSRAEVPYQHSAQLPQSRPGPGQVVEQRLSPRQGSSGAALLPAERLLPRSAACVCSQGDDSTAAGQR